MDKTITFC